MAFDKLDRRFGKRSPTKAIAQASSEPATCIQDSSRKDCDRVQDPKEADTALTAHLGFHSEGKEDEASGGEEQSFGDMSMDEAAAPEHHPEEEGELRVPPTPEKRAVPKESSPLKQFMAKKRTQASRLWKQSIPRISPPKSAPSKPLQAFEFPPEVVEDTDEEKDRGEKEEDSDDDLCAADMSRRDAALNAAQCQEYDLAFRLCILEDSTALLKQVMGVIGIPCMHIISRASRNALCAAFIELLEDQVDYDAKVASGPSHHDPWLVFAWLQDLSKRKTNVQQIDPRVLRALEQRLLDLSSEPTAAGLEAAHVLTQLGL